MDRAGEPLREDQRLAGVHQLDLHQPVCQCHRGLDRIGQSLAQLGLHHQTVYDHGDVVLELLVQHDLLLEAPQLPVHLYAGETFRLEL